MNKNMLRIIVGTLLGVGILVFLACLGKSNALLWTAFGVCVLSVLIFAAFMCLWTTGAKIKYVLNASFPMVAWSYLSLTIITSFVIVIISQLETWTMPVKWYLLIEFIFFAYFCWKILAMDAGKEEILDVENEVKEKYQLWKLVLCDITAVAERTTGENKKNVVRAMEAVKYADPMSNSALVSLEEKIKSAIYDLGIAVDENKDDDIQAICRNIELLVKERAQKMMVLK